MKWIRELRGGHTRVNRLEANEGDRERLMDGKVVAHTGTKNIY